jgi:hypothetical protein
VLSTEQPFIAGDGPLGVAENKRFIAEARDPDQEVLSTEQPFIAGDGPLAVAELPAACAWYDHFDSSD